MRCKIGDLAVIVGGFRDNVGHVVCVDRPHSTRAGWWVVETLCRCLAAPPGRTEGLRVLPPGTMGNIRDASLRPLRDGEVEWLAKQESEQH